MSETLKKSSYNFLFGLLGQVITAVCGILVPRFFIISFGSEVNGFINSVNQVFVYVALLEAGVGTASLQALYQPVSENNRDSINAILSATDRYYRRTGILYVIIIVAVAFAYPLIITSTLEYSLMVGIVLLSGLGGCFTYFFQGKYVILLHAEGKNYIQTNLNTLYSISISMGKVILLLLGFDVLVVQSLYLILNLLRSIYMMLYIRKNYKWIDLKCKPNYEATKEKNAVLVHQVATLIFNNTDILLLTALCDLNTVSIYTMYKYLLNMISTFISNTTNSISFKLGQEFHDREKFIRLYDIYETFHTTLTFGFCVIAANFMIPFLKIYTEGMDINYIYTYMPALMVSVEILSYGRTPSSNVITFAGHFKKTQNRAIIESVINLGSSIILTKLIGLYGVVIGTILALLYRTNDMILYANHKILNRSAWKTYRIWIVNLVFAGITICLCKFLPLVLDTYIHMIMSAAIVCVIVLPFQFIVNFAIDRKSARELISLIGNMKKRKRD